MTLNSNETRQGLTARSRVSGAVAADAKVPHPSDNAQQGPPKTVTSVTVETDETAAIRDYWAAAKKRYQRGDYVDYGSPDWCALPLEDPRKLAGIVAFAQMWLKYGDEIADDLNQTLRAPQELWQRATTEACDTAVRQILAQQQRRRGAA